MIILAFDSSAKAASAALIEDNRLIGEFFINTALTHSQTLVPMGESLLQNTGVSVNDVDAFAVNNGPGSFTGVRIGVSAVKGMAMALDKPCAAVSTLESIAYNLNHLDCTAVCVMDARCNQVYNANFEISKGVIERLCPDRALSVDSLCSELESYKGKLILAGDGAQLCYEIMKDRLTCLELAPELLRFQRASSTAFVALEKCKKGETVTAEQLMPGYLRLPQAQRELKKRQAEQSFLAK